MFVQGDRPQLASCFRALRHGDTLVVWKLDRLGRDLRHLVNILRDLTQLQAADGLRFRFRDRFVARRKRCIASQIGSEQHGHLVDVPRLRAKASRTVPVGPLQCSGNG
ncbi:recombinase family protein [Arthrobacter sp. 2MCAF14]|uniref:recombinase family protein n=1 Tax=Arthrobacter sp. 2MCAF14 TaxID=3232982 RepID=UPI003F928F0A